jgi:PknH-like protein
VIKKCAIAAVALALTLAGCSHDAGEAKTAGRVDESAFNKLLLSDEEINTIMGQPMTAHPVATDMADNRNLLPNLNCLGVWQSDEKAIYGEQGADGWQALRQQMFRNPDANEWDYLAMQSVVYYANDDIAKKFFVESADRWSKCTNHHVNITLNGNVLPKWLSGFLQRTDTRLTMPITRGEGTDVRSCQHVLALKENLIVDAQTCTPQAASANQAAAIADKIEAKA